MHILTNMYSIGHELQTILKNPKHSRLERLYPVVFLEALLRQVPDKNQFVNDTSYVSILKTNLLETQVAQALNLENQPSRAYIVQYGKAGAKAASDDTRVHWENYLKGLTKNKNKVQQQKFARMTVDLAQNDMLPIWINTTFEKIYTKNKGSVAQITQNLLTDYDKAHDLLQQTRAWHEALDGINLSAWADPAAFESSS